MGNPQSKAAGSIRFAAMQDSKNRYNSSLVVNVVEDTPVAHWEAPGSALPIAEQSTTCWPGVLTNAAKSGKDAICCFTAEAVDIAVRRGREYDAHQRSLPPARRRASASSRGIGSPPSARASSAARMSSSSSAASIRASYSLIGRITAVRSPFSSTTNCRGFFAVLLFTGVPMVRPFCPERQAASRLASEAHPAISCG